jgi:hypothetical protein
MTSHENILRIAGKFFFVFHDHKAIPLIALRRSLALHTFLTLVNYAPVLDSQASCGHFCSAMDYY